MKLKYSRLACTLISVIFAMLIFLIHVLSTTQLYSQTASLSGELREDSKSQGQFIKLKGRVIDGISIQPLGGASIRLIDTLLGTAADLNGYFELLLPVGTYEIETKFYGYKKTRNTIVVSNKRADIEFNFFLFPFESKTILVEAPSLKTKTPSSFFVEPALVKHYPATAEYDIVRTFTLLPGINQANSLKSSFYVRGGSSDQNQYLLDGIEIYNPSHLAGLFGAFNFYTIRSADVYTANFPMETAHKLSSVISIHTKTPQEIEEFHASVGVFSSSGYYSRKFGKFGFLVAGRFTYLNLLMKAIFNQTIPYEFYDGFVKITYDINKNTTIDIESLISQDFNTPFSSSVIARRYQGNNTWGNRMVGLHVTNKDSALSHKFTGSFVNHFKEFSGKSLVDESYTGFVNMQLYDVTFRYDGTLENSTFVFKWGAEYKHIQTNYSWNTTSLSGIDEFFYVGFPLAYSNLSQLNLVSGYVGIEWEFVAHWLVQSSVRYSYAVASYGSFIPRLAIFWSPFEAIKVSMSGQWSSQFTAEGQEGNRISIGNPIFILDKPIEAAIGTLGITYTLPFDINISAEGYFKYYLRNIELQRVRPFTSEPYPQFLEGTGYSYGFDFFIDRFSDDGFFFQLAYSYQKTIIALEKINLFQEHQIWQPTNSVSFPSSWMIEHALKGTVGYRHAESGWIGSIGCVLNYGRPITPQIAAYKTDRSLEDALTRQNNPSATESINTPLIPNFRTIPGNINSFSLPIYFTLNLTLKKEFRTAVNKWTVYIQIQNIFNDNGVTYYDWKKYYESNEGNGVGSLIGYAQTGLPIYPSFGVECEF